MSQARNSHSQMAPLTRAIPRRQAWNTHDILCMGTDYTHLDALKEIAFLWNEWADSVEAILRGMINEVEKSHISYDDYLDLVRKFATYPARPADPKAHQNLSDGSLSGAWNPWADAVESIIVDVERAIEHSTSLPKETGFYAWGTLKTLAWISRIRSHRLGIWRPICG